MSVRNDRMVFRRGSALALIDGGREARGGPRVEGEVSVRFQDLLIDPYAIEAAERVASPILFVDLAAAPAQGEPVHLPGVPVVGIGDRRHPLAEYLDAVIEAPVSAEALVRSVGKNPYASKVFVDLLRAIEGAEREASLIMESLAYGVLQGSSEHTEWLGAREAAENAGSDGQLLLVRDEGELRLLLHRPSARNAIDRDLRDALVEAFTVAALDPDIERVSLNASGPVFSIGGDLSEFGTTRDAARAHGIRMATLPARAIVRAGVRFEAHIQGACIGAGLEIVAFADRLTAEPNAWFQLPELSMGLIPGAGGCVSVPGRIGRSRAALMVLSGRRISASKALEWGLIDAIEERPPIDPDAFNADGG